MAKLKNWLQWIDDNLLHFSLIAFIFAISLVPKFPLQHVEYTYIKIRYDDLFPAIIAIIFLVQWLRKKVKLNTSLLIPILLFWAAVFASFIIGTYIQNTIPVASVGFLHAIRRVQYMIIFFVAASSVSTKEEFYTYMKYYLITVLLVCIYGVGQRFFQFPSIQSMNPAYVDGRLLTLNPEDRINSTFGGQFDLAAYLSFSIPIILSFYFFRKQLHYLGLFFLSLIILLYAAARSSFAAYFLSTSAFLLFIRKFKFYLMVVVVTAGLLYVTGDTTKRLLETFQVKTVYVNEQTGQTDISQKISVDKLPAGGFKIPVPKKVLDPNSGATAEQIRQVALAQARDEALRSGRKLNTAEIEKRASEIAKFIKPHRSVLCDISCATRLEIEWPRAIGAFLYNPLFGSGPFSITEATDGDILRWLGEFGLVGTTLFLWIIFSLVKTIRKVIKKVEKDEKVIYYGFLFGLFGLFLNAVWIDVFEASKVAYNFWLIAGLYMGAASVILKTDTKKTHEKRKGK